MKQYSNGMGLDHSIYWHCDCSYYGNIDQLLTATLIFQAHTRHGFDTSFIFYIFVFFQIFWLQTWFQLACSFWKRTGTRSGEFTLSREFYFFIAKAKLKSPKLFGGNVKKKVKKGVPLSLKRNSDVSLKGKF